MQAKQDLRFNPHGYVHNLGPSVSVFRKLWKIHSCYYFMLIGRWQKTYSFGLKLCKLLLSWKRVEGETKKCIVLLGETSSLVCVCMGVYLHVHVFAFYHEVRAFGQMNSLILCEGVRFTRPLPTSSSPFFYTVQKLGFYYEYCLIVGHTYLCLGLVLGSLGITLDGTQGTLCCAGDQTGVNCVQVPHPGSSL